MFPQQLIVAHTETSDVFNTTNIAHNKIKSESSSVQAFQFIAHITAGNSALTSEISLILTHEKNWQLGKEQRKGEPSVYTKHTIWYYVSPGTGGTHQYCSGYRIRRAYLLCRLLCWSWPQTSCSTGIQRSPTGNKQSGKSQHVVHLG